METKLREDLIAPCGMNCGICMAYSGEKNKCQKCGGIICVHSKKCCSCEYKVSQL